MDSAQFLTQVHEDANSLSTFWNSQFGNDLTPPLRQFMLWCAMFDKDTVLKGINRTSIWFMKHDDKKLEDVVRYASGVMANTKRSKEVSRG